MVEILVLLSLLVLEVALLLEALHPAAGRVAAVLEGAPSEIKHHLLKQTVSINMMSICHICRRVRLQVMPERAVAEVQDENPGAARVSHDSGETRASDVKCEPRSNTAELRVYIRHQ